MDHLARMYGTMKPDQAASIFNQMDSDFAAGFLRLMRSEQAGMILAGMETKKAYAVSLRLAAMNEDVRNSSSRIDSIVCSFQDRLILMCPVMIVLAI
jgi:flagellar motility protein MotE (MotC chaperone)